MELVVILLVAGMLLMLLETILPGLISGLVGFGCLMAAIIVGYNRFGFQTGNAVLGGVVAALLIGTMLYVKYFPGSRMARPLVSQRIIDGTSEKCELLHKTGVTSTTLRPCGTAVIDGQRVDVVSEGSMIAKDTPVQVVQVEGLRIVVRAL